MTVFERAYAKINLYLSVGARRSDGYHELTTLMQTVDLFDELTLTVTPAEVSRVFLAVSENDVLPTDDRNLAVRAAKAYMERTGISLAVEIRLTKRIPVSAGMAGGSADAAAVLRAMNRVCRAMDREALLVLAAELGSDVPFCLVGGCAVCRGRGEKISPVVGVAPMDLVLAMSGEPVSTPEAFRTLDALAITKPFTSEEVALQELLDCLADGGTPTSLYNSFEAVVLPTLPVARELHRRLSQTADAVLMSGSGSTVFGIYSSTAQAQAAAKMLCAQGYKAVVASTKTP